MNAIATIFEFLNVFDCIAEASHRMPSACNAYDIAFGPFLASLHLNMSTHIIFSLCIRSRTHSHTHSAQPPDIYIRIFFSSYHFSLCNIFDERLRLKFLCVFFSVVVVVCVLFAGNITFNAKYLYEVCLRVRAWMLQAYAYGFFIAFFPRSRMRMRMSSLFFFVGGSAWFYSVFRHSNTMKQIPQMFGVYRLRLTTKQRLAEMCMHRHIKYGK